MAILSPHALNVTFQLMSDVYDKAADKISNFPEGPPNSCARDLPTMLQRPQPPWIETFGGVFPASLYRLALLRLQTVCSDEFMSVDCLQYNLYRVHKSPLPTAVYIDCQEKALQTFNPWWLRSFHQSVTVSCLMLWRPFFLKSDNYLNNSRQIKNINQ